MSIQGTKKAMGAYNNSGLTTSGPLSVPDHEFGQLPASLPPLESSEMQMNSAGMLRSNVRTKEPSPLLSVPTSEPVAAEDQHLVQQCLKGDEHAWGRLIDKYRRLIYSVPIKYGFRPEDASDVFQTVCLDLFTNLSNLRKVESLRSWLITVTSHKCFHWKKQHRPDVELDAMEQDIAEEVVTPPEMLQEIQQEQIVRDAIDRLPPRCAEMVRLLFFEQPPLPYAEVAKRLGLATGSIGFIRGRCLHRLHKILMELGF